MNSEELRAAYGARGDARKRLEYPGKLRIYSVVRSGFRLWYMDEPHGGHFEFLAPHAAFAFARWWIWKESRR